MWLQWLRWWWQPGLYQTVIVNLIAPDETAIHGVLWRRRGPWLALKQAAIVKPGLAPMSADGDLLIHRTNISFVQVLP